jgi:hypothetical protein
LLKLSVLPSRCLQVVTGLVLLLSYVDVSAQKDYQANPHVGFGLDTVGGEYILRYKFRDQYDRFQEFILRFPVAQTREMIQRFGIPKWMFERYLETPEEIKRRERILQEGLFMEEGDYLKVDKSAVVEYYAPVFCRPIAEQIAGVLYDYGRDTYTERINMAMKFVQDIPYGIPEFDDKDWHYGGIFTPPEVLLHMYGDCDSKAILFAGILIYLLDAGDVIFLNQPDHILTAIRCKPQRGQTYIRFGDDTYVLAETAGPARVNFGQKGLFYRGQYKAERLVVSRKEILPLKENKAPKLLTPDAVLDDFADSFVIRNISSKEASFRISKDRENWKTFSLPAGEYGAYRLNTTNAGYLSIAAGQKGDQVYRITPGKEYFLDWNRKRLLWEIYTNK